MKAAQIRSIIPPRALAVVAAAILFVLWLALHFNEMIATQNGLIRWSLGLLFATLLLLKPDHRPSTPIRQRNRTALLLGVGAMLANLVGTIFQVGLFQWLGIVGLLATCLLWGLPPAWTRPAGKACLLLFFLHPLPTQLFAPAQLTLQYISVHGSEALLHILNVRAWADGLVLRAGLNVFEVPEWCSGMRTATTTVLLAFGLALLKELPAPVVATVTLAGLLQALLLNILRIAIMVMLMPARFNGTQADFLHDSTGIVTLLSLILVAIEIHAWQVAIRKRTEINADLNPQYYRSISEFPPFWRALSQNRPALLVAGLVIVLFATLAFRLSNSHRAQMIMPVAEILRDGDRLEEAQRAAETVARLVPDDSQWSLVLLRIKLIRGLFTQVLEAIPTLDENDPEIVHKRILIAYSLMGLGRIEEAVRIVEKLPERERLTDPGVAMVLAEMGRYSGSVEQVLDHLPVALTWDHNINRIRSLYPFLRQYRRWDAIVKADSDKHYNNPAQALCAMEARMNLNLTAHLAELLTQSLANWPKDPRILEPLYFMAMKQPDTTWPTRFADHLAACLPDLTDPCELDDLADKCFTMPRPELAWLVLNRLQQLDPTSPILLANVAQRSRAWFNVRAPAFRVPSAQAESVVDIRSLFLLGMRTASLGTLLQIAPFGREIAMTPPEQLVKKFTSAALNEFARRDTAGKLTYPMYERYARLLADAGYPREAAALTDAVARHFPAQAETTQSLVSEIHERAGDWQNVYETLRAYGLAHTATNQTALAPPKANLNTLLRLCRAMQALHLTAQAMHLSTRICELFPYSSMAIHMRASVLLAANMPEEALFVLSAPRVNPYNDLDRLEARALQLSHRFTEAQTFCRTALIPPLPLPAANRQEWTLPPAELACVWYLITRPTHDDFRAQAERLRRNLSSTTSPFLARMNQLWLWCYAECDSPPTGARPDEASDQQPTLDSPDRPSDSITANTPVPPDIWTPQRWTLCARDRLETAVALNQLCQLNILRANWDAAIETARAAVQSMPESPLLWRILASLDAPNRRSVIAQAAAACPDDPELWLANLVCQTMASTNSPPPKQEAPIASSRFITQPTPAAVISNLAQAVADNRYPVATITRAGAFLLRGGMLQGATLAARSVTSRARGLLPTYLLGIQCAILNRDKIGALQCTRDAIRSAVRPQLGLYRKLAEIRLDDKDSAMDAEMVQALSELRKADPDNPIWAKILGYVRFHRGGWELVDSMHNMLDAINLGFTNRLPFIIAAEASRRLGDRDRTTALLNEARRIYPNDPVILNNLLFSQADRIPWPEYPLTATPPGAPDPWQIRDLIRELTPYTNSSPAILDTLAVASIKLGDFNTALSFISEMSGKAQSGTHYSFKAGVHKVRIALATACAKAKDKPDLEAAAQQASEMMNQQLDNTAQLRDEDMLEAAALSETINRLLLHAQATSTATATNSAP